MTLAYAGFAVNSDRDLVPLMFNAERKDTVELYFIENDGIIRVVELPEIISEHRPRILGKGDTYRLSRIVSKHKEKLTKACIIFSPQSSIVSELGALDRLIFFNDEDGDRDVFRTVNFMNDSGQLSNRTCSFDCTDLYSDDDDDYDDVLEAFDGYELYTVLELLTRELPKETA
jgi:hypothetical protein